LLTRSPLFYDEKTDEIKRKILSKPLYFPDPGAPLSAKDILTQLLDHNPEQRLGVNGASEIKAHLFCHDIDWRKLLQREYEPTSKPNDCRIISDTMPQDLSDTMLQQPSQEILQQFSG
jgi:serum/glucocorticoid-regulated kinase 2